MKKLFFIVLLLVSTSAMAEEKKAAVAGKPAVSKDSAVVPAREGKFEDRKAELLKNMAEKQACIQSSVDQDSMKSCFQAGNGHEIKFEDRKAEMVRRMGDAVTEMQKRLTCVQAAANPEALKGCFPRMMGAMGDEAGSGNH